MKKNGFTLIELLAVIVILAIIALIVTPVVSGIITSARNSANARSVEGHIRNLELAIISDAFAKASGDLAVYDSTSSNGISNETGIVARGLTIPENDKITCETYNIVNGQVTEARGCADYTNTANWHHTYTYTPTEGAVMDADEVGTAEPAVTPIATKVTEAGATHMGIVYLDPSRTVINCSATSEITATNTGCKKFYIFGTTNDSKYKMIMDRNTTAKIEWANEEDYADAGGDEDEYDDNQNTQGPVTVTKQLTLDTENWIGSPRLITANEVAAIVGVDGWTNDGSKYFYFGSKTSNGYNKQDGDEKTRQQSYHWLFDYTSSCTTYGCQDGKEDSSTDGYWTNDTVTDDTVVSWCVYNHGGLGNLSAGNGIRFGVRPVIEISTALID